MICPYLLTMATPLANIPVRACLKLVINCQFNKLQEILPPCWSAEFEFPFHLGTPMHLQTTPNHRVNLAQWRKIRLGGAMKRKYHFLIISSIIGLKWLGALSKFNYDGGNLLHIPSECRRDGQKQDQQNKQVELGKFLILISISIDSNWFTYIVEGIICNYRRIQVHGIWCNMGQCPWCMHQR